MISEQEFGNASILHSEGSLFCLTDIEEEEDKFGKHVQDSNDFSFLSLFSLVPRLLCPHMRVWDEATLCSAAYHRVSNNS